MVESVERSKRTLLSETGQSAPVTDLERVAPVASDSTGAHAAFPPEILCRGIKPLDLRFLLRGMQVGHFDQPDSLVMSRGVLGTSIDSMRPLKRNRPVTNVALLPDGSFQGFVQFRRGLLDRRWVLTALGTRRDCPDGSRIATSLLEYSVARAGSRGTKRLFARVPVDSEDRELLIRTGFEAFIDETVLRAGNLDGRRSTPRNGRIRLQDRNDTWAVHQLYSASAPRHVQFAEAWTSQRWEVRTGFRAGDSQSWVLEDGFQLAAWARVRRAGNAASLEFMFLPDYASELGGFVTDVLARVRQHAGVKQVFVAARGYQAELTSQLLDAGFVIVGTQDVMIKYTAAKVTAKAVDFVPAAVAEARERVPQRVPTYLNGNAREEPT
ncbi:MAG: hypothetical protein M3Y37_09115 [Chloroflexota bacterium]|nr:hypothetical protein [Chloroflexota bacterium]